jgi:hypothetical protein
MLYLGIDQHRKQLTVSIRNEAGDVVLRKQVSTEWARVRAFFDELRRLADPWMKAWYGRIKRRRGSKIARVAVMRRLTTVIWRMVKHDEPYVTGGPPRRKLRVGAA